MTGGPGTPLAPISAGIFGSIGRVLGGAAKGFLSGGPIGAIRGGVGGLLPQSAPTPPIAPPGQVFLPPLPQEAPPVFRGSPGTRTRTFGGFQLGPLEVGRESEVFTEAPAAFAGGPAIGCPVGFRPNKTSYFLKSGQFVPKGSRCVRNRRRNSLNPKALSRAMSRLEGFKKASSRAGRIRIAKPKCR